MENEALDRAKQSVYAAYERYVQALSQKGIVFVEKDFGLKRRQELREQLKKEGAVFRNDGASIVFGWLSKACVECTGVGGSQTFSTTFKCHRDCYFCFNRNLADYDTYFEQGCPWEEELKECINKCGVRQNIESDLDEPSTSTKSDDKDSLSAPACIALTGGEPLIDLPSALKFLHQVKKAFPNAHTRMYTSGDLLDENASMQLKSAGLKEIRFSVKLDDEQNIQEKVLQNMQLATRYFDDVMVEMPIVPKSKERMQELMRSFDRAGISGMNLLEFCFPFANWDEFAKRGFEVRNPPFPIMYDYSYSGGLAIAGSEELALELMLWAKKEGLHYGLHYCSLENKHRSEMRQKNALIHALPECMSFNEENFFIQTAKLFGPDQSIGIKTLKTAGCTCFIYDEQDDCTAFPIKFLDALRDTGVRPQIAFNVLDSSEEGSYLTEVALMDANMTHSLSLY